MLFEAPFDIVRYTRIKSAAIAIYYVNIPSFRLFRNSPPLTRTSDIFFRVKAKLSINESMLQKKIEFYKAVLILLYIRGNTASADSKTARDNKNSF